MPQSPKRFQPAKAKPSQARRSVAGGEMIHSTRWRKSRLLHLAANPLCVICEANGDVTPASHVDHIKAHQGDPALFWDEMNWRSLCASCHSKKTCREDGGFGNGRT